MGNRNLKELREQREAKAKALASIMREAGPDYDMSKVSSLTGDSNAKVEQIRSMNDELDDLGARIDRAENEISELERASRNGRLAEPGDGAPDLSNRTEPAQVRSLGELFVASDAYKNRGRRATATIEVPSIRNTLFQTSAGWAPESLRTGVVVYDEQRPAPDVVDFIPALPTSQLLIKYMEETTFTNNAAEATAGNAYGEAAFALTERSAEVEKIAVFLPVTDEQLEDEQAAAAYVDQRLGFMIRQRLDLQVLKGDGNTPNLEGTVNVSGIQTQAKGSDPVPDAIYKAMTLIRGGGGSGFAEPSVLFIHPNDWQAVRLLRTTDGIYIWGSPAEAGPERIWGLPVKQTTVATENTAILGDYRNFSALYVRRGVDIKVSDSHDDYFTKGKQAIRADMRCAMVHYRPSAFATVTGI